METESKLPPITMNKDYKEYKVKFNEWIKQNLSEYEREEYRKMLNNLKPLKEAAWTANSDKEEKSRDDRLYWNYYNKVREFEIKHGILEFVSKYWKGKK